MSQKRGALAASVCIFALTVSGCSSLPRSGPDDAAIKKDAAVYFHADKDKKPLVDYVLLDLTKSVLSYFPQQKPQTLKGFGPTRKGPPDLPLGVGDVVQVTIFESQAGGLFVPQDAGSRPGNFVNLPQQTIDTNGTISVPYAGRIQAAGKTPAQVQNEIQARLANRAIEPQAVISVIESRSDQIAVLGDVNSPKKIALNPGGERVLDALSEAGGISTPSQETFITLQRNGTTATVPFEALSSDPKENIYLYPGDTLLANRDRRTFLAFGASGLNGRIDFEDSNLTLAEAVGKAGGLLDSRADPAEVFLYRRVPAHILAEMGTPVSIKDGGDFPVIIRANMRDPSTFFLAQRFPMKDKDILYVSNADSVELLKVLNIISSATSGVAGPAADVVTVRNATR
jgi:polysaccharide export outer membrane protein